MKCDRQYLFTVNPGINTLSMFLIDPIDPWHPKLVGTPATTLGEIPVSVAYSPLLKTSKLYRTFQLEVQFLITLHSVCPQ